MTAGAWSFVLDVEARRNVTRLAGQTALITGGGTGMGKAIALAFSREGAGVAVAGRRIDKLKEVVGQIEKQGGPALAAACDGTQPKDNLPPPPTTHPPFRAVGLPATHPNPPPLSP